MQRIIFLISIPFNKLSSMMKRQHLPVEALIGGAETWRDGMVYKLKKLSDHCA